MFLEFVTHTVDFSSTRSGRMKAMEVQTVEIETGSVKVNPFLGEITMIGRRGNQRMVNHSDPEAENWVWALLSSSKLKTLLTDQLFECNIPGTKSWKKVEKISGFIDNGGAIDSPVLYSWNDEPSGVEFIDGRHRAIVLILKGSTYAPVLNPESQIEMFKRAFA